MSQEDIERIEKKVNLLYQILLTLEVDSGSDGNLNKEESFSVFMEELIPLFNLSAEKEMIEFPSEEETEKEKKELESTLEKLEKDYENGNFLAKEENKIKKKIEDLTDKLEELSKISEFRKEVDDKNKELYEIILYQDLRRAVGLGDYRKLMSFSFYFPKNLIDLNNLKLELSKKGIDLAFYFRD